MNSAFLNRTQDGAAAWEPLSHADNDAYPKAARPGSGAYSEIPQICGHELFERQVAHDPDAVALVFGQTRMSYRELNERANRVAHFLRRSGVGPDVLVGICLRRSPAMAVAMLAVWKAGGAYVPMDPEYPPERLAFMIQDAQTRLLLTEENCRPLLGAFPGQAIYLDTDAALLDRESGGNLPPVSGPADLAYVMYTSGSTGQPKGAMILHRGLVNYLSWAKDAYAVEPGRSAPVHTSFSFDLTVTSLFVPLVAGGSVELLPEDVGAQNLVAALLRAGERSLLKLTPSHLDLLSQQIGPEKIAGLARCLVIGGENLVGESLRIWRDLAPDTRLFNEYGPTETVVGCCVHEVLPTDPFTGSVPIGRPIANTQLYVLDANLQPVADGEQGELYIGGAGVGRGYWNRPELSAERFLADPFCGEPDARMYKSGDLARWRADGIMEYLGRTDDQVKIRGYRIELGEIEAAVAALPGVRSCAVAAREDEAGKKRLVAYLVAQDGKASSTEELRAALKATLPDHMVPVQFVYLDALPLTPNGKADRRALPEPERVVARPADGNQPATKTEQAVAAIWSELFKVPSPGLHDDFFDMGGDSLTGVGLLVRVKATFGVNLELASLFERSTIAGLAQVIDMLVLTTPGAAPAAGSEQREEFDL
jgi:amino acid adenylation domain-containing protein